MRPEQTWEVTGDWMDIERTQGMWGKWTEEDLGHQVDADTGRAWNGEHRAWGDMGRI